MNSAVNGATTGLTDRQLVERWRGGDRRAPNVLIARHRASIEAYFRSRVKGADSEDLVQDTLSKVTRAVHSFEYRSSFRAYLFRIAEHTLKDYLRAAYRRPLIEPLDEAEASRSPAAEQTLVDAEKLRLFLACLESLSRDKQELIDKYYVQQLSAKEIAREAGLPPGTVRRRLFDARKAMQRYRMAYPDAGAQLSASDEKLRAFFGPV